MKKKPFLPSLPGRFGKMTREELDAEADQYDAEFAGINAPTAPNSRPHPKPRRGRPAVASGRRFVRVLVTMPPDLLKRADAYARGENTTRAGLIQSALESVLPKRKSA